MYRDIYVSTTNSPNGFPRCCTAVVAERFVMQLQSLCQNVILKAVLISPQAWFQCHCTKSIITKRQRSTLDQMCAHHCAAAGRWRWWQLARDMYSPSSLTALRRGDGIVIFFIWKCPLSPNLIVKWKYCFTSLSAFLIINQCNNPNPSCHKWLSCSCSLGGRKEREIHIWGLTAQKMSKVRWYNLLSPSFCNPVSLSHCLSLMHTQIHVRTKGVLDNKLKMIGKQQTSMSLKPYYISSLEIIGQSGIPRMITKWKRTTKWRTTSTAAF